MASNDSFIFMKVGDHAGESFEEILNRKNEEFQKVGFSLWGYGGTICHPRNQVQPFAEQAVKSHGEIFLLMQYVNSNANPMILPATKYSADGVNWNPIPYGITVIGSKYALVLGEIEPMELLIPQSLYEVGIGNSKGKLANEYLCGRIDKACLQISTTPTFSPSTKNSALKISFRAKLQKPYAVFVK